LLVGKKVHRKADQMRRRANEKKKRPLVDRREGKKKTWWKKKRGTENPRRGKSEIATLWINLA